MQRVGLRFVEYVNDPIWGEIPLTKVELDLVNSKPFRRLQHIRQMGLAYLAFPTANHRRYEHCIGAMHVAYLLADMLAELAASNPDLHIEIGPAHYQAIRLAALLHDIGHAPYSHAFEESAKRHPALCEFRNKAVFRKQFSPLSPLLSGGTHYSHELFTNYLIQSHPEVSGLLHDWAHGAGGFPAEQIALLAIGRAAWEGLSLFNLIISGDFDADRIDYVCRDSYYCGFHQRFDLAELRQNLVLKHDQQTASSAILVREAGIPAVTTLLWYRYRLMRTVHLNRKNRIATQLLVSKSRAGLQFCISPQGKNQPRRHGQTRVASTLPQRVYRRGLQ